MAVSFPRMSLVRRRARIALEVLESRLVLSSLPALTLDPQNDEYGAQIQTVTQLGNSNRVVLGILDTGASTITVASTDQAAFASPQGTADPIPIKTPNGASADGIGGTVTGDVGQPITVMTDGLHAASMDIDWNTLNLVVTGSFTGSSIKVGGAQAFIGTDTGSPNVPTISGTPVFLGGFNSGSRAKLAAKIDMINGVDFYGLGIATDPDLHFVNSAARIVPTSKEYLATIPLAPIGDNTMNSPGADISSYYNYISNYVQLNNTVAGQPYSVNNQKFLLDTGSQLTVISSAEANALHVDLAHPFDTIEVQGVGQAVTLKGYIIESLQVGIIGNDPLTVKNVPVFVLDAFPGQLDGILGMNLWNNVDQILFNPFTPFGATTVPSMSITYDPTYNASANWTGGFGFQINALLPGHRSSPTLDDYLGAGVRYFKLPPSTEPATSSIQKPTPNSTVPALETPALERTANIHASENHRAPADLIPVSLANAERIPHSSETPSLAPDASASFPTARGSGHHTDAALVAAARIQSPRTLPGALNFEASFAARSLEVPNGDVLVVGGQQDEQTSPDNSADDVRAVLALWESARADMTGEADTAASVDKSFPWVETVLVAALGAVVGEYWLGQSTKSHFQPRILARRLAPAK